MTCQSNSPVLLTVPSWFFYFNLLHLCRRFKDFFAERLKGSLSRNTYPVRATRCFWTNAHIATFTTKAFADGCFRFWNTAGVRANAWPRPVTQQMGWGRNHDPQRSRGSCQNTGRRCTPEQSDQWSVVSQRSTSWHVLDHAFLYIQYTAVHGWTRLSTFRTSW